MRGLFEIAYPVNNDRLTAGGKHVYKSDGLGIKDANGRMVLNVCRYMFDGKNSAERRERALSFTRALVDLLNEHMGKEGAMMI